MVTHPAVQLITRYGKGFDLMSVAAAQPTKSSGHRVQAKKTTSESRYLKLGLQELLTDKLDASEVEKEYLSPAIGSTFTNLNRASQKTQAKEKKDQSQIKVIASQLGSSTVIRTVSKCRQVELSSVS